MSLAWVLRGALVAAFTPVGIAACGGSSERSGSSSHTTATAAATVAPTAQAAASNGPARLGVGQSRLGKILVDASGRTLYFFTQDKPRRALCTSDYLNCTTSWPPVMTTGRPRGRAGVKAGLLASFHRTKPAGYQVTYNGHPLYRYIEDGHSRELKGQGMFSYWYVLSPGGRPITGK